MSQSLLSATETTCLPFDLYAPIAADLEEVERILAESLRNQQRPIAAAYCIHLSDEAKGRVSQFELGSLSLFIGRQGGMQLAAGVDGGIGDADLLDFFEVEQARAVGQRV